MDIRKTKKKKARAGPTAKGEKNLTSKEETWCIQYFNTGNKTKAALIAGYSKRSARRIGWENSTKPHIKARLSELQQESEKIRGVSETRIIDELSNIAFFDISSIVDLESLGNNWYRVKDIKRLPTHVTRVIKEIVPERDLYGAYYKIKLHDKMQALKLLGETQGMFKRKPDELEKDDELEMMKDFARGITARDLPDKGGEPCH